MPNHAAPRVTSTTPLTNHYLSSYNSPFATFVRFEKRLNPPFFICHFTSGMPCPLPGGPVLQPRACPLGPSPSPYPLTGDGTHPAVPACWPVVCAQLCLSIEAHLDSLSHSGERPSTTLGALAKPATLPVVVPAPYKLRSPTEAPTPRLRCPALPAVY